VRARACFRPIAAGALQHLARTMAYRIRADGFDVCEIQQFNETTRIA
jgi:hypothetical protein